jgi:perosamine synthetase
VSLLLLILPPIIGRKAVPEVTTQKRAFRSFLAVDHQVVKVEIQFHRNFLFLDEAKAGMSRAACLKAMKAEGVYVGAYSGLANMLYTYAVFQEPQWWHHLPAIPDKVLGCDEARRTAMQLPYFTCNAPELVDQYAKAFEKVRAHRKELA